jgi:chromosome segregation ATPase
MEAPHGTEPRVIQLADAQDAIELDTNDLLGRLEALAEENGRLAAKAESFERVARGERDARRTLAETLKRERRAAELLHARAERAEAALAAGTEQVGELERALELGEQQRRTMLVQLAEMERELAFGSRPLWRRLFRRPPRD